MFVTAGISSRQQLQQSQSYTSSRILLGSARINDPSFLVGPYQTTHNLFSTSAAAAVLLTLFYCWETKSPQLFFTSTWKTRQWPHFFLHDCHAPRVLLQSYSIHFFPSSDFAAACQHFDLWVINATIKNVDTSDVDNSKQAKTHWDSNLYCS